MKPPIIHLAEANTVCATPLQTELDSLRHEYTCAYCTGDGTDRPTFVDRAAFEAHMEHLHHGWPLEPSYQTSEPDYSHRRHTHPDDVSCADAGEAGHPQAETEPDAEAVERSGSTNPQDSGVVEALCRIRDLQPKAVAYLRANGFVMDVLGPLDSQSSELDRWKVAAFSLYTDLCEANAIAERVLEAIGEQS